MFPKRMAAVLAALVLFTVVGCADGESEVPDEPDAPEAASGETATLGELPVEPGYAWEMARYDGVEPLPVQMTVEGPWVLPSAEGWTVTTTQIVDPADVPGIDRFSDVDFVVSSEDFGEQAYYPRRIADGWMLQLGRVGSADEGSDAGPYEEPLKLWPVEFAVGDTLVVLEGENFRVDATVLAQGTVTVPAGEIDDAFLVRFDYTPITEGAIEGTQYYVLAPGIGPVAMFSVAAGDEASGFTAIDAASVLVSMPQPR